LVLVLLRGIAVPLVEGGAAATGPEGMLEIHLMRISGLRSEDLIGHSDPFVIMRVRLLIPTVCVLPEGDV
jgi:hypothetical protein